MGVSLYRTVKMGDMQALYFLEETERHMSLTLLPEGMEPVPWENKKQAADSLVQAYVRGDDLPGAYSGGKTMRSEPFGVCAFVSRNARRTRREISS